MVWQRFKEKYLINKNSMLKAKKIKTKTWTGFMEYTLSLVNRIQKEIIRNG